MLKNWKLWLAVFLTVLLGSAGLAGWLWAQGQVAAAGWVQVASSLLLAAVLAWGLWAWRDVPWVGKAGRVALGIIITALVVSLFAAFGSSPGVYATLGIALMAGLFYAGLWLVRLALTPSYPILGIARTVLDEAIHLGAPLIFIIAIFIIVPVLPFLSVGETRIEYRLQTFLMWSMIVISTLLALMTLFLSVGTVAREIKDKQIFLTLTKPVGRWQYLAGKWLGIVLLNTLLLATAGAGIYTFSRVLERIGEETAAPDLQLARERVLIARRIENPKPAETTDLAAAYRTRLTALRKEQPDLYGEEDAPIEAVSTDLENKIRAAVLTDWLTLGPRQSQTYRFTGLAPAKELAESVQLRLEPKAVSGSDDPMLVMQMLVNGRPNRLPEISEPRFSTVRLAGGQVHWLTLPTSEVKDDGTLDLQITNVPLMGPTGEVEQPSISFSADDGMEVLYPVGTFEGNIARAMLLLWLRLAFLAMLGVAAATFLGFPVACLICFVILAASVGSGYIGDSLRTYGSFPRADVSPWALVAGFFSKFAENVGEGEIWDGIKMWIALIGRAFMLLMPDLSSFSPTEPLARGRIIEWSLVARAGLWVGLVSTGTAAVAAWLIFRFRELARVIV